MSTFTRFVAVLVVVLSLGFLVAGLPTARGIPTVTGTDAVSQVLLKLLVDVEIKINALAGCKTIADLGVAIDALVVIFKGCAEDLLSIGASVEVEVEARASIVACIAAIISLLVKVCAQVSVKFGIVAVVTLFVKLDVALQLLLVNLNICIGGILVLISEAIASVTVGLLAQFHLKLCLGVLGL